MEKTASSRKAPGNAPSPQVRKRRNAIISFWREVTVREGQQAGPQGESPGGEGSPVTLHTVKGLEDLLSAGLNENSALPGYLDGRPGRAGAITRPLIFPFSFNDSQGKAVENAFSHSISVIEGPPGTGKTQTILNIIANILVQGRTVAIVSNNNTATANVLEKLDAPGTHLGWLAAPLGSRSRREAFLAARPAVDIGGIKPAPVSRQLLSRLDSSCRRWSALAAEAGEARALLRRQEKNLEAILGQGLSQGADPRSTRWFANFSARRPGELRRIERLLDRLAASGSMAAAWWRFLLLLAGARRHGLMLREMAQVRNALRYACCAAEKAALERRLAGLETWLEGHRDDHGNFVRASRQALLNAVHARFAGWDGKSRDRAVDPDRFPVMTSSTCSMRGCMPLYPRGFMFDFLIIDEASQTSIQTAAVCMNYARQVVISGDTRQLQPIFTRCGAARPADVPPQYDATSLSCLDSVLALPAGAVPRTLLREHYRCHPDIIGFCSQRFYSGQMIAMTERDGSQPAMQWTQVSPGRVERRNGSSASPRQACEVREQLSRLGDSVGSVAVISPYREHTTEVEMAVAGLPAGIREKVSVNTVHAFQGQEKDCVIFCPVRNKAGGFNDDPCLVNVAVSRARKRFVLISPDFAKSDPDSNLGALIRYIRSLEPGRGVISTSRFCSIFDTLYDPARPLPPRKGAVESPAESCCRILLERLKREPLLGSWDFRQEYRLSDLAGSLRDFPEDERRYILNGARLDFILFDMMDRAPIAAIEVDGEAFHRPGSVQAGRDAKKDSVMKRLGIPLLRWRTGTAKGREEEQLAGLLAWAYARRNPQCWRRLGSAAGSGFGEAASAISRTITEQQPQGGHQ